MVPIPGTAWKHMLIEQWQMRVCDEFTTMYIEKNEK